MPSFENNPAIALYKNLQVDTMDSMGMQQPSRGLLARNQMDNVKLDVDIQQPSVRVAKHMSIVKSKREEINNDRA
jgi:hypothetical protein